MKSSPRIILELLQRHEASWLTGLQLIRFSDEELARGVIYVHLQRLEDADFVISRQIAGDEFGRYEYRITSAGRAALLRDDL